MQSLPASAWRLAARTGSSRRGARVLSAALLLLLAACAGELATRGEALRLVGTTVPRAILHEPYSAPLNAVGGLRPYTFTVLSGALPAGIELQNGTLQGAATETGTFEVTVEVSDANLSRVSQAYSLQVTAAPPPRFVLDAPQTEVRGAVTVRARLEDARGVTGVRSLVTWDPLLFSLSAEGPVSSRRDAALLWQVTDGSLQVDLAGLGKTLDGAIELYRFTLDPITPPVRVQASFVAEVMTTSLDPERRHDFLTGVVGAAPSQTRALPAAPGEVAPEPDLPPEAPPAQPDQVKEGKQ